MNWPVEYRVALIDQQRFPRDKVCGGGLSRKSIALLDVDISRVVHRWITGAFLTFQNRTAVVKDLPCAVGCTVLRVRSGAGTLTVASALVTHVLAIDAGTTGMRALVVEDDGSVAARGYREFRQSFPRPGWVEHDPDDWWEALAAATADALGEADGRRP